MSENISLTVDIVVFTVIKSELYVLLIRRKKEPFKGQYALPGGYVEKDESLEDAALRELEEETNVKNIFIKKLTAYGDPERDPRGRIVSVSFLALIDSEKQKVTASEEHDSLVAEWVCLGEVKKLAFDHNNILDDALSELKYEIQTTNIAAQLLPEKFTLTEMQKVYEIILDLQLDKRNFRKRLKELDLVAPTKETKMEGAHRSALLYKFKTRSYQQIKDKVHVFV